MAAAEGRFELGLGRRPIGRGAWLGRGAYSVQRYGLRRLGRWRVSRLGFLLHGGDLGLEGVALLPDMAQNIVYRNTGLGHQCPVHHGDWPCILGPLRVFFGLDGLQCGAQNPNRLKKYPLTIIRSFGYGFDHIGSVGRSAKDVVE